MNGENYDSVSGAITLEVTMDEDKISSISSISCAVVSSFSGSGSLVSMAATVSITDLAIDTDSFEVDDPSSLLGEIDLTAIENNITVFTLNGYDMKDELITTIYSYLNN